MTERRKFKGLGEILRFVAEVKGGVIVRTDGRLFVKSVFASKGRPPVLTIMGEYSDAFDKFVFRDDDRCFQGFIEYQDNCFLSSCGKWVLIKDEITEIG